MEAFSPAHLFANKLLHGYDLAGLAEFAGKLGECSREDKAKTLRENLEKFRKPEAHQVHIHEDEDDDEDLDVEDEDDDELLEDEDGEALKLTGAKRELASGEHVPREGGCQSKKPKLAEGFDCPGEAPKLAEGFDCLGEAPKLAEGLDCPGEAKTA